MRYRIPTAVAHVVTEGAGNGLVRDPLRVSVLRLPDGFPVVLTDVAALIWLVAIEGSADVVGDVALGAGQAPDLIRADVKSFLADLEAQGLIERCDDPADSDLGQP